MFTPIFLPQNLHSLTVTRENLCKSLSYKKGACKKLMKLTPGRGHSENPTEGQHRQTFAGFFRLRLSQEHRLMPGNK